MIDKNVTIDDIKLNPSCGKPFGFTGVHSEGELSGIELDITVSTEIEIRQLDELFKKSTVMVADPFVDRQYEAVLTNTSYSYQEGLPDRRFRFQVKELDKAKRFDLLEIEGHQFHVLKNVEDLHDEIIGIHILLRLSPEEFHKFCGLLKPGPVRILRIGIDEKPIVRRFGGAQYWSLHTEESHEFYKQIVRFFPLEMPKNRLNIASRHEQNAHSHMLLSLSARFETLAKILADNGYISQEDNMLLLDDEREGLINAERRISLRSKLKKVHDAELELN